MKALIGHTGFVGSNINRQTEFDFCYNSKNIREIEGRSFDLIVCAGARGTKWKANKKPADDLYQINKLLHHLSKVECKKFVLISTIAVYENPADNAYGRNRLYLETALQSRYQNLTIVRLPALFGEGLKKNAIYDMINENYEYLPNPKSHFQYYYLNNIWEDIQIVLKNDISVMNISPAPVPFCDVLKLFKLEKLDLDNATLVKENMVTQYAHLWGQDGQYIYSIDKTMADLKDYLKGKIPL